LWASPDKVGIHVRPGRCLFFFTPSARRTESGVPARPIVRVRTTSALDHPPTVTPYTVPIPSRLLLPFNFPSNKQRTSERALRVTTSKAKTFLPDSDSDRDTPLSYIPQHFLSFHFQYVLSVSVHSPPRPAAYEESLISASDGDR
jgi:hypothetical protein